MCVGSSRTHLVLGRAESPGMPVGSGNPAPFGPVWGPQARPLPHPPSRAEGVLGGIRGVAHPVAAAVDDSASGQAGGPCERRFCQTFCGHHRPPPWPAGLVPALGNPSAPPLLAPGSEPSTFLPTQSRASLGTGLAGLHVPAPIVCGRLYQTPLLYPPPAASTVGCLAPELTGGMGLQHYCPSCMH